VVVLVKIKSATLIETLTASVLIVIVFMIASLSINSIVKNTSQKDTSSVRSRVKELYYMGIHNKLKLPYSEEYTNWEITIPKDRRVVVFSKKGSDKEFRYP